METDPQTAQTRPNHSTGGLEKVVEMLRKRETTYQLCATLTLDTILPPEELMQCFIEAQAVAEINPLREIYGTSKFE